MNIQNMKCIVENYPGIVFVKDENSRYIDANNVYLDFTGIRSNSDIFGLSDHELPSCKFAKHYKEDDLYTLTFGRLFIVEPVVACNGDQKVLLTHKYSFFDDITLSSGIVAFGSFVEWDNFKTLLSITAGKDLKNLKISTSLFDALIEQFSCEALTDREGEILFYLLHGLSCREIATKLHLSTRTVEDHTRNIKFKLNCDNKNQLIDFAISNGLINVIPEYVLRKIVTKNLM